MPSQLKTIRDEAGKYLFFVDPLEHGYYLPSSLDQWKMAKSLAKVTNSALRDSEYSEYIQSCGPLQKVGELLVKDYLETLLADTSLVSKIETDQALIPQFSYNGKTIDVHTRMVRQDQCDITYTLVFSTRRFMAMVPKLGLARNADIYICNGYSVDNFEGYILGWTTREKLESLSLDNSIKFPAKTIDLNNLYSISCLKDYLMT